MNSRTEKEKIKQIQDKCQSILNQLLREEDNKYCVDCDAKGPRWASWNLGIFLCIRCAGIHRNLGVHISKVKSVNLDTWNPEQVAHLQNMGNSQARAIYEANLPDNFRRPQTDSSLEGFIRAKYETKKYIAKEWVPGPPPKPAFDIEEEWKKEKERRRRKTQTPATQTTTPVPRPQGSSVSPTPGMKSIRVLSKHGSENNVDLLGLDIPSKATVPVTTDNDIFNDFLSSAPIENATTAEPKEELKTSDFISQQENLFSQVQVQEKKVAPMSKESILSLYATAPMPVVQPVPQPQPALYQQMTGGLFMAPSQQPQMFPGMMGATTQPPHMMQPPPPRNVASTNPFLAMAPNPATTWGTTANINQLQQQMASIQLVGGNQGWNIPRTQTADPQGWPSQGQTLSPNLWQ